MNINKENIEKVLKTFEKTYSHAKKCPKCQIGTLSWLPAGCDPHKTYYAEVCTNYWDNCRYYQNMED